MTFALSTAIDRNAGTTFAAAQVEEVLAWLPTRAGMPIPSSPVIAGSPWEPAEVGRPEVDPETPPAVPEVVLAPWTIAALPLTPAQTMELLCCAGDRQVLAPGLVVGRDLAFWARALRLAGGLVARQQYLPGLTPVPAAGATQAMPTIYRACWEPILAGADGDQLLRLARMMPPVARALSGPSATSPPGVPAVELLRQFTDDMVDYLVRLSLDPTTGYPAGPDQVPVPPRSARAPARSRARSGASAGRQEARQVYQGFASIHDHWLYALRATDGRMEGNGDELARLAAEIGQWRHPVTIAASSPFRLCFRLEEPEGEMETGPRSALDAAAGAGWDTAGLTASGRWFVRYLLQAVDDPSLLIPVPDAWNGSKRKTSIHSRVDASVREYVLLSLGQCGGICPEIATSLKAGIPAGYELDAAGAHQFLTQGAAILEQAGFGVMLPAWWSRMGTKVHLRVRAAVNSPTMRVTGGLSLGSIVEVDWQVALGDQVLTYAELQALARIKAPLVRVRGQWVQMNSEEIAAALAFWRKQGAGATTGAVSGRELVRMSLGAGGQAGGVTFAGVSATGWVGEILDRLAGKVSFEEVPVPVGFAGSLRPYQARGYSWLSYLSQWGLGGCLADDMGLGKTVQTLALIQRDWEAAGTASGNTASSAARPVLLVCPTSVVNNWQKEAARFVPDLPVVTHHGAGREKEAAFVRVAERHALVITSYSILQRDIDLLRQVNWAGIVLDEAQNIKNPETKQAQAARALPGGYRLALTGTPVENSVADLWSIMEFLNPGFLGTQEQFRREFFIPIHASGDSEASKRLKRITGPFILRRLKTDRAIIADLPDKLEAKVYCTLTREQASLYAAVVQEAEGSLESAEGIQRKGVILATLSKLKQVCNHPAQLLGDHSAIPGRSGKLARLTEMLEELLTVGDRALVFTQFAEMGDILKRHLQETFGREVLFLHGGVPKAKRDWMVERFQATGGAERAVPADGPAVFVLSVKAGGTGLNLTAANHVFHFDRWWNPAVENQATDRTFRIGQLRNVQVHKFICAGTLEEKIDELIERKRALAEEVVGAGEGWLTRLSNQALREIFALRTEVVGE